ncbi:MAG: hypothetical protein QOG63_1431 [Thermoleophilaceae bacterium]|nr:hypothetical protein [Thermoleophilaceae bacterium]
MHLLAAAAPPAGGAAIDQIVIATTGAVVVTAVLLWLGMGHRSGKVALLGRLGAFSERVSGLPAWAAIPGGTITAALVVALFGMMWDISLHIAQGRDPGPLANPAHYFILAGLFGIFASGFLSIVLPKEKPSASAIRIADGWYAPLGGVLITAAGAFALIGFPLDDAWHRLFGQDVTLWGPTHLMLIGGAAMTLIGLAVLLVEASRAAPTRRARGEKTWVAALRRVALPGAFLLGLSTFQGEFDFGVPQFRLVFAPMLVMLAAGASLVAARIWLGRGAAIGAALFFLAVRGVVALLVGPLLGEPTPHFPLYIVEAVLVELVALRVSTRRPLAFAAVAGAAVGTIGLAAEWGWSHVFMPLPWPSELLPEGALAGLATALAGAFVGAWIGTRLSADQLPDAPRRPLRLAAVGSAVVLAALTGWALVTPSDRGIAASVALTPAAGGSANATVTLSPPGAADRAEWFTNTSWQGGGLVVDRLRRVREGVYRTTEPIPIHGDWKSMLRLHSGSSLLGLPVYLPADPAIPVKGVPAEPRFTRAFQSDHKLLQREQKTASPALRVIAYGAVLALTLAFLVLLAWGVHRLASASERPARGTPARPRPSPVRKPLVTS